MRPLVLAGLVLGIGLGGLLDGIILHQVLQWHHLVSETTDDLAVNVFWDGVFHLAAYATMLLGVALLWRARRDGAAARDGRQIVGGVLAGWGFFNVLDSVVFHWVLGVHHIWPEGPGGWLAWDAAFFVAGLALVAVGLRLQRG